MTSSTSKQVPGPSQFTVAVFADGQNVNLFKHTSAIATMISRFSDKFCLYAYHHWRKISVKKEIKLQRYNWRCIDVPITSKNGLDQRLMQDFYHLCQFWQPDVLVLVTNDGDFAPIVKEQLTMGRQVKILGYKGKISKKLTQLLPNDIYFIEDLYQDEELPKAA
ncbi:MAG: NYN domain-containing protein [Leptolyngbya sp. LCM1.Bin17]|nr:MAG: NYN domain-containing protein [Leptolyngbya sp. LCM1.Bin17]